MELLNFVWLFFIVASLAPMVRQKIVASARRKIMQDLEQKRGTRVIALIHRQESMSILGFPVARYIDIQDSEEILRAIKLTDPQIPIDLILHTPGGLVLASAQIAAALSKHPGKVTVFVPHYAMSGGTMLALAADEIVMDENAVLGPVDPQIGQYPAASILKVLEQKDPNKIDDETLIFADMSRKALDQVKDTIVEIGCCHYTPEQAERIADVMSSGRWTHDYPISVQHAKELGLTVSTDMPLDIYRLMNLYPQAQSRRPSVDYIPLPYATRPRLPEGTKNDE